MASFVSLESFCISELILCLFMTHFYLLIAIKQNNVVSLCRNLLPVQWWRTNRLKVSEHEAAIQGLFHVSNKTNFSCKTDTNLLISTYNIYNKAVITHTHSHTILLTRGHYHFCPMWLPWWLHHVVRKAEADQLNPHLFCLIDWLEALMDVIFNEPLANWSEL